MTCAPSAAASDGPNLPHWATERHVAEVRKLHTRFGRAQLAKRVGISEWKLRKLLAALGLRAGRGRRWEEERPDLAPDGHTGSYTACDYLRDHAGEQSKRRLAREIGCSEASVRCELWKLGMRIKELRTELTLAEVARLTGWSEPHVRQLVARKELRAVRLDGVLRVYPSVLRKWMLTNVRRVRWERIAREDVLDSVSLLAGDWGVSDDNAGAQLLARGQACAG
ncbi:MAG: helix-turn-helix domain-containing protein [Myxococcales bacterium]|nr:helix-turn-helix domain-containing protein [Myxococcales bacterium]